MNLSFNFYKLIVKASDIFLPSIDELQYMLCLGIGATILLLNPEYVGDYFELVIQDIRILVFVVLPLALTVAIFSKKRLSDGVKLTLCMVYFAMFAFLAFSALGQQELTSSGFSFELINYWLTKILLVLALTRGIFVFLIFRIDNPNWNYLVTQNFKDTQFTPSAIAFIMFVAAICVLILSFYYDDASVLALLAFTYTNVILSILQSFMKHKLAH